jgi:ribonucleoside-diphosphate reductase alpha chain
MRPFFILKKRKERKNMENRSTTHLPQNNDERLMQEGKCPDCGAPLAHESGCMICYNCGWSACS